MAEKDRVVFDTVRKSKRVLKVDSPNQMEENIEEFKCVGCNRVLALVAIVDGMIVIKCKRCKAWNVLDIKRQVEDNSK